MNANPFLGVVFHWLGGLASGSFYVPYRGVKKWAWEVYWLVGGVCSWIFAPWILALINTRDVVAVLSAAPASSLFWGYFWGAMWGVGGLTFGLTMRYLGMSLGMGIALGFCAAFGTLMPPLFHGEFVSHVLGTTSGRMILFGVGICVAGIAIAGLAGISKEREMTAEQKRESIKEFNFSKGLIVAVFSGVMSSCFAYALDALEPVAQLSLQHGTSPIWTGLPKLCVVLLGGFTTNFIWCVYLNVRNGTGRQYFSAYEIGNACADETIVETATDAPGEEMAKEATGLSRVESARVPLVCNYLFSALAGVTWYFQFFFYTMGETQMGDYKFSSWTLHMASIIIFSSMWGLALLEWKGASRRTMGLLFAGLLVLVVSTIVVGYGNYLGAR